MFDKKNYVLNCDICDARKMKEEDYNNYKNMIIKDRKSTRLNSSHRL